MKQPASGRQMAGPQIEPGGVTFMLVGVLIIAGLNLLRLREAVANWAFWREILPVSPLYLGASGLLWALIWLLVGWATLRGHPLAARFSLLAAWAYTLYTWLDRLVLRVGASRENLPFLVVLNLVLLAWLHWTYREQLAGWFSRSRS